MQMVMEMAKKKANELLAGANAGVFFHSRNYLSKEPFEVVFWVKGMKIQKKRRKMPQEKEEVEG